MAEDKDSFEKSKQSYCRQGRLYSLWLNVAKKKKILLLHKDIKSFYSHPRTAKAMLIVTRAFLSSAEKTASERWIVTVVQGVRRTG